MSARRWFLFVAIIAVCIILSAHGVEAKKDKTKAASTKGSSNVPKDASQVGSDTPAQTKSQKSSAKKTEAPADSVKSKDEKSETTKKAQPAATEADDEAAQAKERQLAKEALARKAARKKADEKKDKRLNSKLNAATKRNAKLADKRRDRQAAKEQELKNKLARLDKVAKRKSEADAPGNKAKGISRLNWFTKSSARASNNIVSLEEDQWQEYVNSGPRPYWVFLVFQALGSNYQCPMCHLVHSMTKPIAQTYEAKRGVIDPNVTLSLPEDKMPIFFAEVDIGRNQKLFNKLGLNNAPIILLVPPRIGVRPVKERDFIDSVRPKYRFTQLQHNMQADDLAAWINKNRPEATPVYLEPVINPGKIVVMLAALVVGIVLVIKYGQALLKLRAYRRVFQMGGLALYMFAVSGGMYNVIRDVPFSGHSDNGQEGYISYSGRDQYAAEGYLMGGANMLAAVFLTLMVKGSFDTEGEDKKTARGPQRAFRTIWRASRTLLSPLICSLLATVFWFQVVTVYTKKNAYYRMGWLL